MGGKIKRFFSLIVNQDYIFSVVSKFAGVFIALVYSIIFTRYIGAELKGETAIISNYISLISSILCLGMYQAYPYFKKRGEDVFYPFLNNMTSFYILAGAGFALAAVFLPIAMNIKVALFLIPLQSYIRHINYVVTIEKPKTRNIASMVINVTDIFVVLGFMVFATPSYNLAVAILVIQTLVNFTISFANLKMALRKFRFTLKLIPRYAKFGFMPMITLFLMTVNYRIDVIMLEKAATVATTQIGIYSVGVALAEKVWLIPDAVKDILRSRLCKDKGKDEVAKVIRLNLFVAVMTVLFTALVSKPFVDIVYGADYAGADIITVILLVGIVGMIFYKMVYSYNITMGKQLINLVFLAVAAAANVVGNLIFIPMWGIYGAALTSVISYTLCGICFLIYFKHSTGVPFRMMLFIQKEDIALIKSFIAKMKQKKKEKGE